jgi:hypothetical protein
MSDVAIRKGDQLPQIDRQFIVNGFGINLTSATVTFNMWKLPADSQVITNSPVVVTNALEGNVRYLWTANDALLDAGVYIASFTATYGDGRRLTAPNNNMIVIEIFDTTASNWSYTGQPGSRQIDAIRFIVGDTDPTDQLVTDEEIQYMLNRHGSVNRTSAEVARAIAAKFARLMSRSIGGLTADFSAKYRQYMELAANLTGNEESEPVSPFISGFNRTQKESVELESDRETTFSRKGIHDNNRVYPADDFNDSQYRLR